jgi:quercetin dioxygenase-like cupin family protein
MSSDQSPAAYRYLADLHAELPDIPPDSIISRTLFSDGRVNATLFGFAAGQELTEHTSTKRALLHVVSGEAQLTLGADKLEASAGAFADMPANLPHSISAKTNMVMLLLLIDET